MPIGSISLKMEHVPAETIGDSMFDLIATDDKRSQEFYIKFLFSTNKQV